MFARYFIRRVRFSDTDPKLAEPTDRAFEIVPDIYAERTSVASFPLGDAILDRYDEGLIEQADELSAGQFFALVAAVQQSFCGGTDGQAVSATAQIPADTDPAALQEAIRGQLGQVKGLTVFPEVSRALAPYQRLTKEEYQTLIEQLGGARATDTGDSNDGACRGAACPIR